MVRSQQMHRAAFVSVETQGNQRAVVEALGKQLVNKEFSAADNLEDSILELERVLREQSSLLVIDNMETILLPPFMREQETAEELKAILALCERLLKAGDTRVIFTSREALPAPFDAGRNRRELYRFNRDDAVMLVEHLLNSAGANPQASSDVAREEIEQLVDAVHRHARTLTLLAPALRAHGVEATRESIDELMAQMETNFPGSREKSVLASVKRSLQRMSTINQDRARVLGVFHGGVNLFGLQGMMEWEDADVTSLASELVETGLATRNRYNHLTLNPALSPYLRKTIDPAERDRLTAQWITGMREYVDYLVEQQGQNIDLAVTLTQLELSNLFALLDIVQRANDPEATIELATSLYQLLQPLGKPRLLRRLAQIRDAAAAALGDTLSRAQFEAARSRIEQQLSAGELGEALAGAQMLHDRATSAGEQAYPGADYDIGLACFTLACALKEVGQSEQALSLLAESSQRFEAIAKSGDEPVAETMVSTCFSEKGACLWYLGQFDEAVAAYEEGIRRDTERGDLRGIAVGKGQIGSIRSDQCRYDEALEALAEARERFTQLDEPESIATVWHQTGNVYHEIEDYEAAEDAYRNALVLEVRFGDVSGQAKTLCQLGMTYDSLERYEEAVAFYQQAVDKSVEQSDLSSEGLYRHNVADTLRKLERFDEARQEIRRAIECVSQVGHASKVWLRWACCDLIETDAGNPSAAADAKRKAIDSYLAYRRDGGENHDEDGDLSLEVTQYLLAGDNAAAASFLQQAGTDPDLSTELSAYLRALQAIVAGSRDRTLADAADLNYGMAAEILLLIETLENHASGGTK
jgi:tetratricopeptide (TPR) repeat protein